MALWWHKAIRIFMLSNASFEANNRKQSWRDYDEKQTCKRNDDIACPICFGTFF
jgi:hypothetical protein